MQCCLGSLGQHCRDFLPVQCCLKSIKAKLHRTSIYPMLSGAFSDNIAYGFDLSNVIPRVLRQHCTGFGLMHCCLEPLEYNCIRFWPVQSWPKSIKRKLYRIFSYAMLSGACQVTCWVLTCEMLSQDYQDQIAQDFFIQCCSEPLGQHYIGFLPVQCCLKSITATLNRIFSYTMLYGATQTTLHKILTYAMLSQEY